MLQAMGYVGCCTAEYVVDILLSMHAADVTCRTCLVQRVVVVYIVGFSKLSTVHSRFCLVVYRVVHAVSCPLTIVAFHCLVLRISFGLSIRCVCWTRVGVDSANVCRKGGFHIISSSTSWSWSRCGCGHYSGWLLYVRSPFCRIYSGTLPCRVFTLSA
jgi:hypothetical protein